MAGSCVEKTMPYLYQNEGLRWLMTTFIEFRTWRTLCKNAKITSVVVVIFLFYFLANLCLLRREMPLSIFYVAFLSASAFFPTLNYILFGKKRFEIANGKIISKCHLFGVKVRIQRPFYIKDIKEVVVSNLEMTREQEANSIVFIILINAKGKTYSELIFQTHVATQAKALKAFLEKQIQTLSNHRTPPHGKGISCEK